MDERVKRDDKQKKDAMSMMMMMSGVQVIQAVLDHRAYVNAVRSVGGTLLMFVFIFLKTG